MLASTSIPGLTSAVLLLSILSQLSNARPSGSNAVVQRSGEELNGRPIFHEHKYQRIYRKDDPASFVKLAGSVPKSKRDEAHSPAIKSAKFLGASSSNPSDKWLDVHSASPPSLPAAMYDTKMNRQLTVAPEYSSIYKGSGALRYNSSTKPAEKKLKHKPRLSRDGGLGGKISGRNVFLFADTEIYSPEGDLSGFVSSSAATNGGHQAKQHKAPELHDRMGEWANDAGNMRGWVPYTDGEAGYNAKMAGEGLRYALWPQSSLIPIDADSALIYVPIVFANSQGSTPVFQSTGVTICKVTIPGEGGVLAERITPMLWHGQPDVEWGVLGGIHGYGPAAAHGGKVYILGNHKGGVMLGRVDVGKVGDSSAYEYWHSDGSWTSTAPGPDATDNFVEGYYSNMDVFYSPAHSTFIMVYMNAFADSTFYWRYLQSPSPIKPSSSEAWVENITKHPWSDEKVLFSIPNVADGQFAYSGGMYRGYFDKEDISSGGKKMLIGWAQPTGKDGGSAETGFQHKSAEITFA